MKPEHFTFYTGNGFKKQENNKNFNKNVHKENKNILGERGGGVADL